ncbi:DMT family transporter [Reinekea marinisedimentorum]|uniref:Threonine/homoserine efflux transporter RhtA n=1 Tax=Reinekea marinisedimentorum TaxID=230495 RepID=A0A4R3I6Y4_9GAMM|nr:DMT family transporter [Reinekea marinisedimentorum]TCS41030.1 threonine/homoserine efflux transporter RhtA [Reinekea marinisedimentorum]
MTKHSLSSATLLFAAVALIFFAANSVLARMALIPQAAQMDAGSFVLLRLFSAVVMLWLLLALSHRTARPASARGSWRSAAWLFLYALSFAYAYRSVDAGSGALVLFGSVQLVMFFIARLKGAHTSLLAVTGVVIAMAGLGYLMWPLISTPSLIGVLLMAVSGAAWAFYTIAGQGSQDPLQDTAYNFLRTLPFCLALLLVLLAFGAVWSSWQGVLLAVLSGALASGIGYAVWYSALRGLSGIQAGSLQLLVPAIASAGGIPFAGDLFSWRLVISTLITLAGIFLVMRNSQR